MTICVPNPCTNGGYCVIDSQADTLSSFYCRCPPSFTGVLCATLLVSLRLCRTQRRCGDFGRCVPADNDRKWSSCSCLSGYTGLRCEDPIIPHPSCVPSCQNGAVTETVPYDDSTTVPSTSSPPPPVSGFGITLLKSVNESSNQRQVRMKRRWANFHRLYNGAGRFCGEACPRGQVCVRVNISPLLSPQFECREPSVVSRQLKTVKREVYNEFASERSSRSDVDVDIDHHHSHHLDDEYHPRHAAIDGIEAAYHPDRLEHVYHSPDLNIRLSHEEADHARHHATEDRQQIEHVHGPCDHCPVHSPCVQNKDSEGHYTYTCGPMDGPVLHPPLTPMSGDAATTPPIRAGMFDPHFKPQKFTVARGFAVKVILTLGLATLLLMILVTRWVNSGTTTPEDAYVGDDEDHEDDFELNYEIYNHEGKEDTDDTVLMGETEGGGLLGAGMVSSDSEAVNKTHDSDPHGTTSDDDDEEKPSSGSEDTE